MRVGKVDSAIIYGIQKNYLYCLRVLGFSIGGDGTMSELVYFTLGEDSISSLNSLMSHRDVQTRERTAVLHVSISWVKNYNDLHVYFLYTTDVT